MRHSPGIIEIIRFGARYNNCRFNESLWLWFGFDDSSGRQQLVCMGYHPVFVKNWWSRDHAVLESGGVRMIFPRTGSWCFA